jgi:hypothetical protein
MNQADIMTAISTVGFPIVAYLMMVFKSNKTQEQLADAVNNNTIAIREFVAQAKKAE